MRSDMRHVCCWCGIMMSPLNGTHSLSSYRILADSLCSGGESDVSAMFSRIVAAAEPTVLCDCTKCSGASFIRWGILMAMA